MADPDPLRRPPACTTESMADLPDARARVTRIYQSAFDTVGRQHLSELDESYYETLRTALLDAGATEREIDGVAAGLVTSVVEATLDPTASELEIRREQFELIGQHVARTRLTIAIAHGDACIKIDLPDRPATH
jgi:hypothetical protein